jgi:DNA-binding beta-propeller fold protein YncE
MRLFPFMSGRARVLWAEVGGALAVAALIAGCGNNYRPVVTPITSNGPAAQPTSYAVVVSAPSAVSNGIATIIDYSGDSVMASAPIGLGPLAFVVDEIGGTGYTFNIDHTITNFPITTTLQQKNESTTTLPALAQPINLYAPNIGLWIGDLNGNVVDTFSGSPQAFKLAIPLAPASTPVYIAGSPSGSGQRQYAISQNIATPTGVECNQAPQAQGLGVATPIEASSFTTDVPIPVGKCPVFAVQSPDLRRLYVLNRGDDTITVINSQTNALDNDCPPPTGCVNLNGQRYFSHRLLPLSTTAVTASGITPPNGTTGMGATAGPVYAEYNQATSQLVVANYDGGTVSIVDVSLDQYGNDSSTFGTTYTVPVGTNPASVTVLFDGTRAYTANQGDCTGSCTTSANGSVSIINLVSHTIEKKLGVVGVPRTVVSTQNSLFGKVYVASPNSPFLTIVGTQTDLIATTVLVEGNVVDVRATSQTGTAQTVTTYNGSVNFSNPQYSSRIPGYGQPCNLPPTMMAARYGANYTLAQCRAIP